MLIKPMPIRISLAAAVALLLSTTIATNGLAQSPCPPADSGSLSWVQDVLTEPDARNRALMDLTHLEGQIVTALGSSPGDDAVCSELYDQLRAEVRSGLEEADPVWQVLYYRVGDRYLVHWTPRPDHYLRVSQLISFDLQFNELRIGVW